MNRMDATNLSPPEPIYPVFSEDYFGSTCEEQRKPKMSANQDAYSTGPLTSHGARGLINLDLANLPRDDGPPSELQARREKFAYFEKQCSPVHEGIFLGGDLVAKNREILKAAGITHVVNCVGFVCDPYFKDELTYKVLYLQGATCA